MGIELTFDITLNSDYHVGAGYGKGFGLDSALLREANGTLVLRGSMLTGLLRGGAYQLLGLEPLQRHVPDDPLTRLFGTPKQAKRWHIASARPMTSQTDDAQAVQRVRVDPRTRRTEPSRLFSQEEGKAGQVFRFTVTCAANDASALDDAALLVAAARYVRQLGRSRRRGLGECVIHLTKADGIDVKKPADQSWEDWFLARFESSWLDGSPTQPLKGDAIPSVQAITSPGGAAVRIRIIVRLDEPLIIAERAPAGNQFDTLSYIPGSAVLGSLAGQAAERCDLANPDKYHDFVALFLRGGMMFPILYPAHEFSDNLYPTIPAPLGLMTCNVVPFEEGSEGHGAYPAGRECPRPRCKNRLEPVGGFVILKQDKPYTKTLGRSSELHIKVKEETQRVERGQLYGYAGGRLTCRGSDSCRHRFLPLLPMLNNPGRGFPQCGRHQLLDFVGYPKTGRSLFAYACGCPPQLLFHAPQSLNICRTGPFDAIQPRTQRSLDRFAQGSNLPPHRLGPKLLMLSIKGPDLFFEPGV